MTERGRTIREAIIIALEGLPGSIEDYTDDVTVLREYLLEWMHAYSLTRGVILSDEDIITTLNEILAEMRGPLKPRTITKRGV